MCPILRLYLHKRVENIVAYIKGVLKRKGFDPNAIFPLVVVAACIDNNTCINKSYKSYKSHLKWDYNGVRNTLFPKSSGDFNKTPELKAKIQNAPGGNKERCAEQHLANQILIKYPKCEVCDIRFSKAVRPRTGIIVPYCETCLKVFEECEITN